MIVEILPMRSGRTYRMIKDVLEYLNANNKAVIICNDTKHMIKEISKISGIVPRAINTLDYDFNGKQITFLNTLQRIDEVHGKYIGTTSKVFVDHYAIESKYKFMLDQWIKYGTKDAADRILDGKWSKPDDG